MPLMPQSRPSAVTGFGSEDSDRDKSFQYLLWEENRISTYATLLKVKGLNVHVRVCLCFLCRALLLLTLAQNPEQMRVVFFESKRNEI